MAENQQEWAVELLGLAFSYPTSVTGWMTKWTLLTRLRASLESNLGSDHYKALWDQGKSHNLQTTIATLHRAFQPENKTESVDDNAKLVEPLSEREREVLRLLAVGFTNPEIADKLIIAIGTVKAHTSNIYSKLGTRNRVEAVQRAIELGLIDRHTQ